MMQFMPATGRRYGLLTREDFHNPSRSIEAAARYVRDLNLMFDGRIDLVLAGYNAGEYAVLSSGYRVPPYAQTRSYVARGVSVYRRIAQANILSLHPQQDIQSSHSTKGVALGNRTAPRPRRSPTRPRHTRSIYFSL
jgi:hypothetical protein